MAKAKRKAKAPPNPSPVLYTLIVTREQAAVLQNACELIARLGMCQTDMVEWFLPFEKGYDISAGKWAFEDFERAIKPLCGLDGNAYYSMPGSKTSETAKRAWGLYTTIRHRLAWDAAIAEGIIAEGEARKWPEMMQVFYDEPRCYVVEPAPCIARASSPPEEKEGQ